MNLKEGPTEIVKGLEDMTVIEETDALLSIELNKPNEEIEWFKDGVKLKPDVKIRIYSTGNTYFLRVSDCDTKASPGKYTFKVKGLESSCNLQVKGIIYIIFFYFFF